MIDAYEIGIKLALENGVSEGLAKVRQDLGMLDQAVATTARGLAQLRAAAGAAVAATGLELPRIAAAARPNSRGVVTPPDAGEPASAPAAAAVRIIERERDRPAPAAPVPPAASVVQRQVVPAATPAPAVVPVAVTLPAAPAVMAGASPVPPAVAPVQAPAAAASPPVMVQVSAHNPIGVAPAVPSAAPVRMAAMVPPQAHAHRTHPATGSAALRQADVPSDDQRPVRAPRAEAMSAPEFTALGRAMLQVQAKEAATQPARRAAIPTGTDMPSLAAQGASPLRLAAREEMRQRAAAPAPVPVPVHQAVATPQAVLPVRDEGAREQARTGPTHGDVYLDGVLVGRWMSDAMTREADRPPSGPTGFDARRSAAWPGATVGP